MKRHILSIVAVVFIVTALSLVFVACDNPLAPNTGDNSQKTVSVYLLAPDCNSSPDVLKSFEVTTTAANVHDLLLQLKGEKKISCLKGVNICLRSILHNLKCSVT